MKIRLWHILVFVVALAVFAVARAPAAFFLQQHPGALTYDAAEGTIWNGTLRGAVIGPYRVTSARWSLSPLDLVQGKAIAPVSFAGDIEGDVILLGNLQGDRRIGAAALRIHGAPVGMAMAPGETRFHGLDILFEGGACARAQGRVESDVLVRAGEAIDWSGPPLSGAASCDGRNARITLQGANAAGERVNAHITLMSDGAAAWRVAVHGPQPSTQAALTAAGFTPGAADGALGYGEETRWLP